MIAYVFPGQGSQFPRMGEDLYTKSSLAKDLFHQANDILGFNITEVMFGDNPEDLKQTKVTQPAIFIHSVILAKALEIDFSSHIVAGHSLGEFSALTSANYLTFEDGLQLVAARAFAMQKACDIEPSTMAAILGLENNVVEDGLINRRSLTNIGTFRAYIEGYLRKHNKIHDEMTFLVRQLSPSSSGLPIEIYVFANDTDWINYEAIQSDIFDHLLAVVPEFDLKVFQHPSGNDFNKIL